MLKTESEEIWKSMATAERTLSEMGGCQDFDTTRFFVEEDSRAAAAAAAGGHRESDTLLLKQKNDRKETEEFYMNVSCGCSRWKPYHLFTCSPLYVQLPS